MSRKKFENISQVLRFRRQFERHILKTIKVIETEKNSNMIRKHSLRKIENKESVRKTVNKELLSKYLQELDYIGFILVLLIKLASKDKRKDQIEDATERATCIPINVNSVTNTGKLWDSTSGNELRVIRLTMS